jgi:tryptophanyl-tRNA synthetase
MSQEIILNGIRSNDTPTLGNYIGSIIPVIKLQNQYVDKYQFNLFIPDILSFTTPINHQDLYLNTVQNLKYYVAAGIDINYDNIFIYRQSYIPALSELAVIFCNFTGFGEMSRMTQFKDKSLGKEKESISVGLFTYPILMAADILLYGASYIPVGEDQKQHLEFTRDIAMRINNRFNTDLLKVPHEWQDQVKFAGHQSGLRIKSLKNPDKKMSKSNFKDDPNGIILLIDEPDEAYKKVMTATTDSIGVINYNPVNQPGITNLMNILANLVDEPIEKVITIWQGQKNYSKFKTAVADEVRIFLENYQKALNNIDESDLMRKIESSEYLLRDVATQKLYKIQQIIGLRP